MPSIRSYTPQIDQETDSSVKLQVWISQRDKRTILSAVGDDGVFTFVIRTLFQRIANHIRTNDISCLDDSSLTDFVEFVRNGTHPRADRSPPAQHVAGATKGVQHSDASASSESGRVGSGRSSRVGSDKKREVKRKQGG